MIPHEAENTKPNVECVIFIDATTLFEPSIIFYKPDPVPENVTLTFLLKPKKPWYKRGFNLFKKQKPQFLYP